PRGGRGGAAPSMRGSRRSGPGSGAWCGPLGGLLHGGCDLVLAAALAAPADDAAGAGAAVAATERAERPAGRDDGAHLATAADDGRRWRIQKRVPFPRGWGRRTRAGTGRV